MHHDLCDPIGGSKPSRARYVGLGLVLVALTHASGCKECDTSRSPILLVELVDEAGSRLSPEAFTAAFDAAMIEVCVEEGPESHCFMTEGHDLPVNRLIEVRESQRSFPEGLRCEFPTLRINVEVPGCEPGEVVFAGEEATFEARFEDVSEGLTLVCAGA
jgi:hypothetical protein